MKILHESSKMYIEALKNSGFKEEFTYLEPRKPYNINDNNNKLDMNKENTNRNNTPSCFDGGCNLCLEEKIQIMLYPDPGNVLNQRCNLIARCRHRNRFTLS